MILLLVPVRLILCSSACEVVLLRMRRFRQAHHRPTIVDPFEHHFGRAVCEDARLTVLYG